MEALLALIPDNVSEIILAVAAVLTLALPALEWIVKKTTFKWDDQVYLTLVTILGLIPRVRLGTGITTQLKDPKVVAKLALAGAALQAPKGVFKGTDVKPL